VQRLRADQPTHGIWQVAGCRGIGGHRGLVAEIESGPRRRTDAHVRHKAGKDDVLAPQLLQRGIEPGLGKGIWQRLVHHGLAVRRSHRIDDGPAAGVEIEQPTWTAPMLHVHDRGPRRASPAEEPR
jgi:hypothetical protein